MISFSEFLTRFASANRLLSEHESLQWVLLSNGRAYDHDSVIFFGIKDSLSPTLVVKTPRLPEYGWTLEIEYSSLVGLWACMGKDAENHFPKPIGLVMHDEQPALILSYLQGESLLFGSGEAFWGNSDQVFAFAGDVANILDKIFRSTYSTLSRQNHPSFDFSKRVEKFGKMYPLSGSQKDILKRILGNFNENLNRSTGKVLLQGDFWHGNIIRDPIRGNLLIVDWQYARWSNDVSLDVYLFLLAGALAAAPSSAAVEKAQKVVGIISDWKKDIIPSYLEVFRNSDLYSLLPLRDGMLLCCVEKATRAYMDFGHSQSDDEIWWHIFNELTDWDDS